MSDFINEYPRFFIHPIESNLRLVGVKVAKLHIDCDCVCMYESAHVCYVRSNTSFVLASIANHGRSGCPHCPKLTAISHE